MKDAREVAREIVVSEFKEELCDKHADTCLCGKARDIIAAAIRNARAETWEAADKLAGDRAREWAGQVGDKRTKVNARRAARAVEAGELSVLFEARAKAEREP